MIEYKVIGLMSGTSLDGLDLAYCVIRYEQGWTFSIEKAVTFEYDPATQILLKSIHEKSARELADAHAAYGRKLAEMVEVFVKQHGLCPDFISSHGHTIFHQPALGYTFQLGDGAVLAAASGFAVVSDFRTGDVGLGGQGAPLVPVGDKLLFNKYEACLNLGGIANISFDENGKRIAGDICACNLALNRLSLLSGKSFDNGGEMAAVGTVNESLLHQLEADPYLIRSFPKSLGREDLEASTFYLLDRSELSIEDRLATATEFIARQIGKADRKGKLLITGGGALNHHLVSRIRVHSGMEIIVPEENLIQFKEALVFAFLGVLRWRNEINVLESVTGASKDHSAGAVFLP